MDAKMQNSAILPLIRAKVKERLLQNEAFRALSADQRAAIARDTVKALHYIVGGEDGTSRPTSMTLAGNAPRFPAGPRPAPSAPGRAPQGPKPKDRSPGTASVAAMEGAQAFTGMISDVNFPQFVGGLIDGVFNSIVTSSIKQMEAYAELVQNVSKSVDQYMKDNVSENNARDYLTEKYPNHLEVDIAGEKPRIKPKEGYDEESLPDFFNDLGLKAPVTSLDEDNVEQELVPAARRRIAMDRQQLLATMVMMGVNRLVVTNGTIEASCMFELDTTDSLKRAASRTTTADFGRMREGQWGGEGSYGQTGKFGGKYDLDTDGYKQSGDWSSQTDVKSSWFSKGAYKDTANFKMSTVTSQDSETTINMHAQLGGKVKVNFKSDYFPMEKMVDVLQINQIREKTAQRTVPAPPAVAAPPAPPLPPLPQVPMPQPAAPAPAAPAAPRPA